MLSSEIQKYIYTVFSIMLMSICLFGFSSSLNDKLSDEICACFDENKELYVHSSDQIKRQIIEECYTTKIKHHAQLRNEEHLKTSNKSKLIDLVFEISKNMSTTLKMHCDFVKINQKEIWSLLNEKVSISSQVIVETSDVYIGEVLRLEPLDEYSNHVYIKLSSGEIMKCFYRKLEREYVGQKLEFVFEEKVINADTIRWINSLKKI